MTRDWLHASTHGIARRSEIDVVGLRDVGLLPMLSAPISPTGVDALKYSTNPGVSWTNSAYARCARAASSSSTSYAGPGRVTEPFDVEQRRLESGGQQCLQVAVGDPRLGVLGGDHLALLGEPQRAVHRSRRLREDGVVAGAAAAADGAAATVEEPQPDSGLAGRLDQVELGAVQRPVGRQIAAVLVGVGIAEHDLLAVAA